MKLINLPILIQIIGIYEIIKTDTPDITCINEAVELAKKYSDDKVCKMINGVLDKVYHNKENKQVNHESGIYYNQ